MSVDTIGNFLTVIRNRVRVSGLFALGRYSKLNAGIGAILKAEGFVKDVQVIEDATGKKQLKIFLKYVDGESVIHCIDRVSKPSRRVYTKVKNLKPVIGGLGISIVSTNKGLLTDKQIKNQNGNVGGEIICTVW